MNTSSDTQTTWPTKQDAIEQAILPALGEYTADHDIDAIFDEAFAWEGNGFQQTATAEQFWAIVQEHAVTRYAALQVKADAGWQTIEVPQETTDSAAEVLANWRSNTIDGPTAAHVQILDSDGHVIESAEWSEGEGAW